MSDAKTTSFFHSDQVDQKPLRHTLILRLLKYLKPYLWHLLLLLALMGGGAVLEVLPSEFTRRLIDHHLTQGSLRGAGPLLAAFVSFVCLSFAVQLTRSILLGWVGQKAMLDLRLQLFGHLMRRSTSFFQHNPVGRLMTRVTTDVQNLNEMFSSGFVAIVGDALSLLAIVVWMYLRHPWMATIAIFVVPFLMLATEIFRRKAGEAFRETQGRYAAIQAYLQERLSNMSLVQLNANENAARNAFDALNGSYLTAFLRTVFAYSVFFPVVELLTSVTLAAVIFYAGYKVEMGGVTLGLLLAFVQQSGRFFRPIRELAERYNVMQTAMASSERIFLLLDNRDEIPAPENTKAPVFEKEIRFNNLTFAYESGGRNVISKLNGSIPKGKRIAVVGHTGAGKSTLINLLMRFYDPTEGGVTLDGVDIREVSLSDYRGLFGLVLQDVFIFSGSLEDNILLGRPMDKFRLASVLEQSQLVYLVERLPMGLKTEVGERGQRLSAGERQLLAFARMLYGNPAILLLDEATANIDSETERRVQDVFARVSRHLTTFTIAHRLSTIQDADEIWVMDQGSIVERGNHSELLDKNGIYANLVKLQFDSVSA
ncbi:MAG: ABC transporter ATP-binding protein/permease [Holophagales bacterium]|jgi:ATP-binding cassette subfamily B protein|nr:ABC transporter ATP-binding protein/permease [Holophagales bacterium]